MILGAKYAINMFFVKTVKSVYIILKEEVQGDEVATYECFWRIKALPLSHFAAWRVMEDKIASKENLERKGISSRSNMCSLHGEVEETTSYLFCT